MTTSSPDEFLLDGRIAHIPDWMKNLSCRPDHSKSYGDLIAAFAPLTGLKLSEIDSLAVRCLLIHEWRRILFQFDKVEPEFWTSDWPEAECHRFVCGLYQQLLPASETWMDTHATCPNGPLPQPLSSLDQRFT
jgi:phenylacetic acid degradation operon negative regulatory protein